MALDDIKKDLARRVRELGTISAGTEGGTDMEKFLISEIVNNIYPMMQGIVDAIGEDVIQELDALGDQVDELVEQSADFLQPTTASQILSVFEAGTVLGDEIVKLLQNHPIKQNEEERERILGLVGQYGLLSSQAAEVVVACTVAGDEGDGDDEEDDEEGSEGGVQ